MDSIRLLATLLPLSLTSGINLYATTLVIGVTIRLGWISHPPAGFDAFAAWPVIIIAGVMYLIEFLADKIQFVDNAWDVAHTFIRPIGAAILGIAALSGMDPALVIIGALLAGGVALVSHGGKATARLATNVASPAENISNIVISLGEDALAGLLAFISLQYPYLATGITLVVIVLILIFMPLLLQWTGFTLKALFSSARGFGRWLLGRETPSDALPDTHLDLVGGQAPQIAFACQAQGLRGAHGASGYLAGLSDSLAFTFHRWRKSQLWQIKLSQVQAVFVRNRPLVDVLELHYAEQGKKLIARFVFLKDRTPLAEQLAVAIQHGMEA